MSSPSAATAFTEKTMNTFVFGDLIIDHTAFVSGIQTNYPLPVTGETAFRVKRRKDTAGGAATTARTINMLSNGMTFLWGLIGHSPWGSFRSILENSQALDGATRRIEFRGAHDETEASMTTISRLVAIHDTGTGHERYERKVRFADYGQIHIPLVKQIEAISYHLDRVHKYKAHLDSIILNDFDMGALSKEVVKEIADFADKFDIPLIIRARRDASKFHDIMATALVCTLAEWNQLVNTTENIDYWRKNIHKREVADEFARCTIGVFKNINNCVILIGDDLIECIIVVERLPGNDETCTLISADGIPLEDKGKSQQIGASDVFTGALAAGICCKEGTLPSFQTALNQAITVIKAYQCSHWNRIPRLSIKSDMAISSHSYDKKHNTITSRAFGTPFLPETSTIDMSTARTCIPDIYSVTPRMINILNQMLKDVKLGDKSLVLAASGGSGKSAIAKQILLSANECELEAFMFADLKIKWDWSNPEETVEKISAACKKRSSKNPFVIADEVLKSKGSKQLASKGVLLLDAAKAAGIRFLLIDADFAKLDLDDLRSQFARRVEWHDLPPTWERPNDFPYVLVSCLWTCVDRRDVNFSIEASALISIAEWMLQEKHNFGNLFDVARDIALKQKKSEKIIVQWDHLPKKIKDAYLPHKNAVNHYFNAKLG